MFANINHSALDPFQEHLSEIKSEAADVKSGNSPRLISLSNVEG